MSRNHRKPRTFDVLPIVLVSALLHVIGFASLAQIRFTGAGDSRASAASDEDSPGFVLLDLRPTMIAPPEPELQAPEPAPEPAPETVEAEALEPPQEELCADAPALEPALEPVPVPAAAAPAAAPGPVSVMLGTVLALALQTTTTLASPPAPAAAPSPPAAAAPAAAARPLPGARLLKSCEPRYPSRCIERGIEGSVLCRMHVDASGAVVEVEIVESSGNTELDRAAQRALAQWRFDPPRVDGRTIESRVLHRVTFRLTGRR